MKKLKYIFFLVIFGLTSCEEVIELDLPKAEPRLVIEASIDWVKGTDGSTQKVRLTTTAGYYDIEIPIVSNAIVSIEKEDGTVFDFIENEASGEYYCYNFIPEIGKSYTLTVVVDGEVYTASEKLFPAPEFLYFEQNNEIGFGDDVIEIKYYFQDNPDEDNFYMDRIEDPTKAFPIFGTGNDKFTQGNAMYGLYFSEDLKAGDVLNIRLYQISERYHDYMNKLLEAADNGGGPFQTTPSTVRGNLINQTNPANYALGYFRLSEVFETSYTVE